MKRSLDGLRGLPLGVLVERLGGEALRFRDERRLAGLVKLEGEDADGGDGAAPAGSTSPTGGDAATAAEQSTDG